MKLLQKLIQEINSQKDRRLSPADLQKIIRRGLEGLETSEKHLRALIQGLEGATELKDGLQSKLDQLVDELQKKTSQLKDANMRLESSD